MKEELNNPYEEPLKLGYDLSRLRPNEEYELHDLIYDDETSPEELENALRSIRLKHLYVVNCLFILMAALGFIVCWYWFEGLRTEKVLDCVFFALVVLTSLLSVASTVGLGMRTQWGMKTGILTARMLLLAFPFGTIVGLFAITAINDCAPEFD